MFRVEPVTYSLAMDPRVTVHLDRDPNDPRITRKQSNKQRNVIMFQEEVTNKDGTKKTVVAGSQKELDEAVKAAKNESAPVYPNINHPVQKGHDLFVVDEDVNKVLVNGEGAHNSPLDAIDEDGNERGDDDVPAFNEDEPRYMKPGESNEEARARDNSESDKVGEAAEKKQESKLNEEQSNDGKVTVTKN